MTGWTNWMLNLQYQCQSNISNISTSNGTNKDRNSPACYSASAVLYKATETSSGPNEELGGTMHFVPVVFLGFIINLNKSVVEPLHTITFLGFLLNSTMTTALPQKGSSDSAVGKDVKSNTDPSQN